MCEGLEGIVTWKFWVSCASIAAVILGSWLIEIGRKRFNIFDLKNIFLLYILLQFAIWPVAVVCAGTTVLYSFELRFLDDLYSSFVRGQAYILVGICFFYLGYLVVQPSSTGGNLRIGFNAYSHKEYCEWNKQKIFLVYWGSLTVSGCAVAWLVSLHGGFSYFIQNIDLLRTTEARGWGVFLFPIMASQIGLAVFTAYSLKYRRYEWLVALGLLVQIAIALVVGIRTLMIVPIATTLVLFHLLRAPITPSLKMAGGILLFVIANMVYSVFRSAGFDVGERVADLSLAALVFEFFGRFHGSESIARIVDVVDRSGFHYGVLTVVDLVVSAVPRVLWLDKPDSLGIQANLMFWPDIFGKEDTGAAVPTLIGELYWMFGLPAICVGMLAIGIAFRWQTAIARSRTMRRAVTYAVWFSFALFVNETLNLHLFQFIFRLSVLWLIILFVQHRRTIRIAP